MTIKKQFAKLKDNWLLILLPIFLIFLFMFISGGNASLYLNKGISVGESGGYAGADDYYARGASPSIYPPYPTGDFDPTNPNRKITKSASLSTQVEKGTFSSADSRLRSIVESSDSILLNENVNANDKGWKTYKQGSYTIKVDSAKYDSVVTQLKTIGEVMAFYENADDITGQHTDVSKELAAEKAKLARYNDLYKQNISPTDRVALIGTIFDQERRISYLEDQVRNLDKMVSYSTISVSIQEKRSDYADIAFARFSDLVRAFVASVNSVLYLIVSLLPYIVAIALVWWIYKKARR